MPHKNTKSNVQKITASVASVIVDEIVEVESLK